MSILDLELRAKYRSEKEAAKARGWTVRQVRVAIRIGRFVQIVIPVDRKGAPAARPQ